MAATTSVKPQILLISLDLQPWFDDMYSSLIDQLHDKATIQRARKGHAAIRRLSEDPPKAVLVTDAAITTKRYANIWDALLTYVRDGGIAVCMGLFSSSVPPLKIKPFFEKAGLPWEAGSYHRTTVVLDKDNVPIDTVAFLPESYSQKAVFLKNVDNSVAWYRQSGDSVIESSVFLSTHVEDISEVPVALVNVGERKLGYIGDVNTEEPSNAAILAMCGLHG
jgi:hypothetical protein